MRTFRFLPPSPEERRSLWVLGFGSLLGQFVAFVLLMRRPEIAPLAFGAAFAIWLGFFRALWSFDSRSRRARNAQLEIEDGGLKWRDERGSEFAASWGEIELNSRAGRAEISFGKQKLSFGLREIENAPLLLGEIARRTNKSNVIPLMS